MTEERAAEIVSDVSYFGTIMVHLGMADGMVSGAAHTTAHTIVPSFQIIQTAPGTATVSGVFLMCLSDRYFVYGRLRGQPGSHRRAPGRYRDPGPTTHRHARSRPWPPRRAAYPQPFRRTDARRGYRARR